MRIGSKVIISNCFPTEPIAGKTGTVTDIEISKRNGDVRIQVKYDEPIEYNGRTFTHHWFLSKFITEV